VTDRASDYSGRDPCLGLLRSETQIKGARRHPRADGGIWWWRRRHRVGRWWRLPVIEFRIECFEGFVVGDVDEVEGDDESGGGQR
jgi:hypothetical protein